MPQRHLRAAGTGEPRSHERRRPTPAMTLLAQAMAQVGRIGGNLAQFLKLANRGEIVAANDLDDAVREPRAFIAEAQKALRGRRHDYQWPFPQVRVVVVETSSGRERK